LRTVAIVGARNASAAGQRMTQLLAGDLAERGYVVVSGLARGIDAAAHKASLSGGTVAVLAGGLDHIYPEENAPLARSIVEAGGALVTEMPMGWQPRAQDFPRRNRIVSGMSLGVVVVEAAKKSGSLITARLALEQDRDVFAVPGSPLDPRAEGGNHLIQEGAKLVTSAEDIIEVLNTADPTRTSLLEPDWEPEFDAGSIDTEPSNGDRARLIEALSPAPVAVDHLIATTQLSVSAVQTLLLELDLAGRIEWSSGQLVALRP
jgi:DNA processing protein